MLFFSRTMLFYTLFVMPLYGRIADKHESILILVQCIVRVIWNLGCLIIYFAFCHVPLIFPCEMYV